MTRLICFLIALALPQGSLADRPPVLLLDGTNGVNLPGHFLLDIPKSGTIEFYVAARWKRSLDYDPVVLAALTPEGPRYAVAITGDRQAIALASKNSWDLVEFDFSDGKMHHVAFVVLDGITDVYIDGIHEDLIDAGFGDQPTTSFHIGSLNGEVLPFKGAIAALKIWETALDPNDIAKFRDVDMLSEKGQTHPDYDALAAVGAFGSPTPTLTLLESDPGLAEVDPSLISEIEALPETETFDAALADEYDAENAPDPEDVDILSVFEAALEEEQ